MAHSFYLYSSKTTVYSMALLALSIHGHALVYIQTQMLAVTDPQYPITNKTKYTQSKQKARRTRNRVPEYQDAVIALLGCQDLLRMPLFCGNDSPS